jgi:hypothetical protein
MQTINKKCPDCGSPLKTHYEPQTQEYPGAAVWPGSSSIICTNEECFYEEDLKSVPIDTGKIREAGHVVDYEDPLYPWDD